MANHSRSNLLINQLLVLCPYVKFCTTSSPKTPHLNPAKVPQYLLIILQLVIQDDSVGLVRLRPREGNAVHGAADLVHDGHG